MTYNVKVGFTGGRELQELLNQLQIDFGEKDAKNILTNAVRASMQPVLATAKVLAPIDTGQLRVTLQVEARRPTSRDKRSKYVKSTDSVIGLITTAPAKKLARGIRVYDTEGSYKSKKDKYKKIVGQSDARAVAMEFGTANVAARPYLRPALESQAGAVLNSLSGNLKIALEKYKAKQARKVLYGR